MDRLGKMRLEQITKTSFVPPESLAEKEVDEWIVSCGRLAKHAGDHSKR